jgi:sugar phosphate isomerase/epimerase
VKISGEKPWVKAEGRVKMKLGGSIATQFSSAAQWGEQLSRSRFAAVTCPVTHDAPDYVVTDVLKEAKRLHVTIAEVGVWKNPLAPNASERESSMKFAKAQLKFADEIGAPCCVNIVGSRGARWDGAYADNYSEETYQAIVASIREIIDSVRPERTFYTIEPMPWMVPDGPDEYLQLLRDVDRERFAVHMDFVNMVNCPRRFLFAEDFIQECFEKLGPYIKSCHAKDVLLEQPFTSMLREVAPGQGKLDYAKVLRIAARYLPAGMPFLLEHMQTDAEYAKAYDYVAGIAKAEGIPIR